MEPIRPSRILDQHFGIGLDFEDLLSPFDVRLARSIPRCCRKKCLKGTNKCCQSATRNDCSTITADKDKFQVNLDVQHFAPEEITVKVSGNNTITVEGKHKEKQDEHGFISRQFVRKYVLPEGHDTNNLVSNLSSDGVLSITAPRLDQVGNEDKTIPIQQTGVPSKPITNKREEQNSQKQG